MSSFVKFGGRGKKGNIGPPAFSGMCNRIAANIDEGIAFNAYILRTVLDQNTVHSRLNLAVIIKTNSIVADDRITSTPQYDRCAGKP
jgi:hypothetical protein